MTLNRGAKTKGPYSWFPVFFVYCTCTVIRRALLFIHRTQTIAVFNRYVISFPYRVVYAHNVYITTLRALLGNWESNQLANIFVGFWGKNAGPLRRKPSISQSIDNCLVVFYSKYNPTEETASGEIVIYLINARL